MKYLINIIFGIFCSIYFVNGQNYIIGPDTAFIYGVYEFNHTQTPSENQYHYWWQTTNGIKIDSSVNWVYVTIYWQYTGTAHLKLWKTWVNGPTILMQDKAIIIGTRDASYTYDNAGNRISRQVVEYFSGFKAAKVSQEELDSINVDGDIKVFPNPADEVLYLKVNDKVLEAKNAFIYLYNNKGVLLYKTSAVKDIIEIPVGEYLPGIYFLVLNYDSQRSDWKVIIR